MKVLFVDLYTNPADAPPFLSLVKKNFLPIIPDISTCDGESVNHYTTPERFGKNGIIFEIVTK
jgi:hypothetical protein